MKALVFSTLLISSAFSFANEAPDELANRAAFQSQASRSEVIAQYLKARAEGTLIDTSEAGYAMHGPVFALNTLSEPKLTRQQVVGEYVQARAEGSLVDTSEAGSMHFPTFAMRRVERAEVYAARAPAAWAESD